MEDVPNLFRTAPTYSIISIDLTEEVARASRIILATVIIYARITESQCKERLNDKQNEYQHMN